jgi:ADP-heptose:LPS heptosyltransferase
MGVCDEASGRIRMLLGRHAPAVLIHPGSSAHTPYKRYTTAGYAQIARALADAPGVDVRIACGPAEGERALARAIVDAAGGAARLAPATPDVQTLAALCRESLLFVGSDSGPLHVASMVGTPVVQLLGPRHPIENEPWSGTAWRRVYLDLACSPCRRGCPTAPCMRDIPPSAVIAAARDLLAARGFASVASRVEPPALAGVAAS